MRRFWPREGWVSVGRRRGCTRPVKTCSQAPPSVRASATATVREQKNNIHKHMDFSQKSLWAEGLCGQCGWNALKATSAWKWKSDPRPVQFTGYIFPGYISRIETKTNHFIVYSSIQVVHLHSMTVKDIYTIDTCTVVNNIQYFTVHRAWGHLVKAAVAVHI